VVGVLRRYDLPADGTLEELVERIDLLAAREDFPPA
jgi:hypothetical protein